MTPPAGTAGVEAAAPVGACAPSVDRRREETLFCAAIGGDRSAIEALWSLHRRWVAVVLLAHKSATADLDDLMQEVAYTLLTRIGQVRGSDSLRPWLRMVAVNAARANARTARLRTAQPLDGLELRECGAAQPVDDEATRLLSMVAELPEPYRVPLLLRCLHELTTRQVAELLALPETTIETRVARARKMLRERRDRVDSK